MLRAGATFMRCVRSRSWISPSAGRSSSSARRLADQRAKAGFRGSLPVVAEEDRGPSTSSRSSSSSTTLRRDRAAPAVAGAERVRLTGSMPSSCSDQPRDVSSLIPARSRRHGRYGGYRVLFRRTAAGTPRVAHLSADTGSPSSAGADSGGVQATGSLEGSGASVGARGVQDRVHRRQEVVPVAKSEGDPLQKNAVHQRHDHARSRVGVQCVRNRAGFLALA